MNINKDYLTISFILLILSLLVNWISDDKRVKDVAKNLGWLFLAIFLLILVYYWSRWTKSIQVTYGENPHKPDNLVNYYNKLEASKIEGNPEYNEESSYFIHAGKLIIATYGNICLEDEEEIEYFYYRNFPRCKLSITRDILRIVFTGTNPNESSFLNVLNVETEMFKNFNRTGEINPYGSGYVHSGYLSLLTEPLDGGDCIQSWIQSYIHRIRRTREINNIFNCGHSLGAALATISHGFLTTMVPTCITVGIATPTCLDSSNKGRDNIYTLINDDDDIIKLPSVNTNPFSKNENLFHFTDAGKVYRFASSYLDTLEGSGKGTKQDNHSVFCYMDNVHRMKSIS